MQFSWMLSNSWPQGVVKSAVIELITFIRFKGRPFGDACESMLQKLPRSVELGDPPSSQGGGSPPDSVFDYVFVQLLWFDKMSKHNGNRLKALNAL